MELAGEFFVMSAMIALAILMAFGAVFVIVLLVFLHLEAKEKRRKLELRRQVSKEWHKHLRSLDDD